MILLLIIMRSKLFIITFIFFFNYILLRFIMNVFSNKKCIFFFLLLYIIFQLLVIISIFLYKSHLLMIWRSKNFFVLSFFCEFGRKNLTLNTIIRFNIRNREGYSLMHQFSIQIFTFHFFLLFTSR